MYFKIFELYFISFESSKCPYDDHICSHYINFITWDMLRTQKRTKQSYIDEQLKSTSLTNKQIG